MSKLNRWLAQFQQHMCDMDPTIKLNTSFFQLATISMLCLLEDLIFYSPASSAPPRPPAANFSTHFFLSSFWLDKRFISIIGTTFMVLLHFIWGQNIPFQPKLWLFKKARSAHFFRSFSVWRDGIFLFFWFHVVCYGVSGCNTCFAMSYGWQLGVYHDDALLLCAKEFNSSMLCHSSKLWKIF